jgi:hypothetical protein
MVASRLRQIAKRKSQINVLHCADDDLLMPVANKAIVRPSELAGTLAQVVKAVAEARQKPIPAELAGLSVGSEAKAIADSLASGQSVAVLLGNLAAQHPQAVQLQLLAQELAGLLGGRFGFLGEAANQWHVIGRQEYRGVDCWVLDKEYGWTKWFVGVERPADDERVGDALNQRPGGWVLQAAPRRVKSIGDCERALHIVAAGHDTGDAGGGGTVTRIRSPTMRQSAGYAGLTGHERDEPCPRGDAAAGVRQSHQAKVHFGARRDRDTQHAIPACQPTTAWRSRRSEGRAARAGGIPTWAEHNSRAQDSVGWIDFDPFDEFRRLLSNLQAQCIHDLLALAPGEHKESDDE